MIWYAEFTLSYSFEFLDARLILINIWLYIISQMYSQDESQQISSIT